MPDAAAVDPGEAHHDVGGVAGLDLQEVGVVDDASDDLADVVAGLAVHRDDVADLGRRTPGCTHPGRSWSILSVVLGQEADQLLGDQDGLLVIVGHEAVHAGDRHVRVGAAELILGDVLTGDLLDHVRPGDEHVGLAGLDDEVGQGRGVDRATGAGAGDDRDLRDHTGQQHVGVEHLAVAGQRVDALLDPGAARIVEEEERRAVLQRGLHHRHNLLVVGLAGRTAGDGEVLAGHPHRATQHGAAAGDHAIGGHVSDIHAEGGGPVPTEQADLFEAVGVQQGVQPLAGRHLALLVLLGQAGLATTEPGLGLGFTQCFDALGHRFWLLAHLIPLTPSLR